MNQMSPHDLNRGSEWKSPTVILQAVMLIVGGLYWAFGKGSVSDQAQRDVTRLEATFTTQFTEFKKTMEHRFVDVFEQIKGLPDFRNTVNGHDRRIVVIEDHDVDQDKRITALERVSDAMRSDLAGMAKASAVTIPTGRGR